MIGVAIPAYQVCDQLAEVVGAVPEYVDHIVIVNDASADGTADVAATLSQNPRVQVVTHQVNGGVGAAVMTGFHELMQRGCQILVKLDGDGQMDPTLIGRLVDPLIDGWADYAKGNRLSARADIVGMPTTRLAGSVILTFLTKIASGYWQTLDPQNGFVAVTGDAFERLDGRLIDKRYFFENSMLIALNMISARCMDIRMAAAYGDERSNMSIWRILCAFPPRLVRGFVRRVLGRYLLMDFSPVFPLLTIGTLMLVAGAAWGSYQWWLSVVTGHIATTGTVMLAVLPLFSGLQMVLQALVLDIEHGRALTVSEQTYLRDRRDPQLT